MSTRIRLLLLFIPLFFRFSFSPVFNIEIFGHFSRELRPRRLKLGTNVDSGLMYHLYRNQASDLNYYAPPPESGGVLCYTLRNFECPSVRPSVCLSVRPSVRPSAPTTILVSATPPTVLGQSF